MGDPAEAVAGAGDSAAGSSLPDTVTKLRTVDGADVYLVGTAHFSEQSQADVSKTIEEVQPDAVMLELCKSRVSILQFDEATLLEEAKSINFDKVRSAMKQLGVLQGVLHVLLLTMSAHLTRQLGMAPGGEFRTAVQQAKKLKHECKIHLGDRPIQITMKRAIAALSTSQKLRLGWYILTCKEPISKEDIEKYKKKDILEEMLEEMTGEFPALSRVFVEERDQFLAHSLRDVAAVTAHHATGEVDGGGVVVGVVGIGHVPGIVKHWHRSIDIDSLVTIDEGTSYVRSSIKWSLRLAVGIIACWTCCKVASRFTPILKRLVT